MKTEFRASNLALRMREEGIERLDSDFQTPR